MDETISLALANAIFPSFYLNPDFFSSCFLFFLLNKQVSGSLLYSVSCVFKRVIVGNKVLRNDQSRRSFVDKSQPQGLIWAWTVVFLRGSYYNHTFFKKIYFSLPHTNFLLYDKKIRPLTIKIKEDLFCFFNETNFGFQVPCLTLIKLREKNTGTSDKKVLNLNTSLK